MKKSDAYISGMQDALQPFSEQQNKTADSVRDLQNHFNEIIDCIIWNHDDPEKLIEMLKRKRASKPKQFRIAIVYSGKENDALADALRKDLNKQQNTCHKLDYHLFVKHGGSIVDRRIYIGNPEQVKEANCKILYKAYGMRILQDENAYIVEYNPKFHFDDTNKDNFIKYYESIISKSLERSKAAERALKNRKRRKNGKGNSLEPKAANAVIDAVIENAENSLDFWCDKPEWMLYVFGLPSSLVSLAGAVLTTVLCIPVAISEILLRGTIENLQEANFDSKFVAEAQKQILEVKMLDLFKIEQTKDIQLAQDGEDSGTEDNSQSGVPTNMTDDNEDIPPSNDESHYKHEDATAEYRQSSSDSTVKKVNSKNAKKSKFAGITLGDAIRYGWMDATFAVERKRDKMRRERVNRAATDKVEKKP